MQIAAIRNVSVLIDDGTKATTDFFMRQVCFPLKVIEK